MTIMTKNININITKKDYVYINGETGQELTKEEFIAKHGGLKASLKASLRANLKSNLGRVRITPTTETKVEGERENEEV